MASNETSLPRTSGDRLGKAMGVVSLGLAGAMLATPDAVAETVGVRKPTRSTRALMRFIGSHELMAGAGILSRRRAAGWLWSRVLGDVLHLGLLAGAMGGKRTDARRLNRSMMVVGGCLFLDVLAAMTASRGGRLGGPLQAKATTTIRCTPEEAYRRWRDLESLPTFMDHLESVEDRGDGRSRWTARGPAGSSVSWDAEITEDVPGRRIGWRSVEGSKVATTGAVTFTPAVQDQGTEVTVELSYKPPAGRLGAAVALLLGEEPEQQIRDDLRRFKQIIETGEVIRSDGSPEGMRTSRLLHQRPAQPLPA